MQKPRKLFLFTAATIVLLILFWFIINAIHFIKKPLLANNQPSTTFILRQGTSLKRLANDLEKQNLLHHKTVFIFLARLSNSTHNLKPGEYSITSDTTPLQLLHKLTSGEMIHHEVTLVEGWTFKQILAALAANQYLKHSLQEASNEEIMRLIGHEGENPEGRFAPDTYLFSGQTSDIDVLKSSYDLMQKRLQEAWEHKDSTSLPYHCPYETLIVASIIEKETAYAKEKPLIAGVIIHRLTIGMPLQVDPTVIYGLGTRYTGKLTFNDLLHDTPYNTYTRKGLPQTPIAAASLESIEAALHPIMTNALYYVAKGDGSHVFSTTLKEQNAAIKRFRKKNTE